MIRIVDRLNDQVVQKIVSPKGKTICYQYGIPGQGMTQASTLAEARKAIGKRYDGTARVPSQTTATLASAF